MSHRLAIYMCRVRSIQMMEQLRESNEKEKAESKKEEREGTKREAPKGLRRHRLPR